MTINTQDIYKSIQYTNQMKQFFVHPKVNFRQNCSTIISFSKDQKIEYLLKELFDHEPFETEIQFLKNNKIDDIKFVSNTTDGTLKIKNKEGDSITISNRDCRNQEFRGAEAQEYFQNANKIMTLYDVLEARVKQSMELNNNNVVYRTQKGYCEKQHNLKPHDFDSFMRQVESKGLNYFSNYDNTKILYKEFNSKQWLDDFLEPMHKHTNRLIESRNEKLARIIKQNKDLGIYDFLSHLKEDHLSKLLELDADKALTVFKIAAETIVPTCNKIINKMSQGDKKNNLKSNFQKFKSEVYGHLIDFESSRKKNRQITTFTQCLQNSYQKVKPTLCQDRNILARWAMKALTNMLAAITIPLGGLGLVPFAINCQNNNRFLFYSTTESNRLFSNMKREVQDKVLKP